ncbi:lipopolysaccharide biosynthesis protein [Fusobacterium ulcerans]|uniref:lipopolysaccharide biosynthesis protein n=1 Tax=Fusobacterium ulcerans TaxID=861 RepID=UPI002E78FEB0|nr:lipopolysaccharide biosynthesis protein [Fusobacterium ulcerans]MEE0138396.1 lipopolysaccharide biosynthesis protein [Fusobacterium ulcerans]
MENNLKSKVLSSLIWKLLERGGTQGIQFLIQIILARMLTPDDYGVIAIIMIFIALANVFIQSGFNTALIQKKKTDDIDFSSVFYLSLGVASILYIILYLTVPIIANFYKTVELIKILRVLSLTLFLGVFNSIQNTIIIKNMEFKKEFFSSLIAVFFSGILGIILAYKNYGVWALVYQQLANQFLICLILWNIVRWRPKFLFSLERIRILFAFSGKLLLSSLFDTFYMNITSLVIGKIYTTSMLGFYNRGNQFPQLIISNFNGSIQAVIFPALSAVQEDRNRIKEIVRRSIVTSSYIIFPLMIGLMIIATPLIKILLTDKWLPCVPYLRIFCLSYALWPIHTANLQAINAVGRSDIFLKLEIIKKILGLSILIVSMNYGMYAIAVGVLITGILSSFINGQPNKIILNYGYLEQIKDICPSLVLSLVMGCLIYPISMMKLNNLTIIIVQIILGVFVYIFLSYILKLECFIYIVKILKNR